MTIPTNDPASSTQDGEPETISSDDSIVSGVLQSRQSIDEESATINNDTNDNQETDVASSPTVIPEIEPVKKASVLDRIAQFESHSKAPPTMRNTSPILAAAPTDEVMDDDEGLDRTTTMDSQENYQSELNAMGPTNSEEQMTGVSSPIPNVEETNLIPVDREQSDEEVLDPIVSPEEPKIEEVEPEEASMVSTNNDEFSTSEDLLDLTELARADSHETTETFPKIPEGPTDEFMGEGPEVMIYENDSSDISETAMSKYQESTPVAAEKQEQDDWLNDAMQPPSHHVEVEDLEQEAAPEEMDISTEHNAQEKPSSVESLKSTTAVMTDQPLSDDNINQDTSSSPFALASNSETETNTQAQQSVIASEAILVAPVEKGIPAEDLVNAKSSTVEDAPVPFDVAMSRFSGKQTEDSSSANSSSTVEDVPVPFNVAMSRFSGQQTADPWDSYAPQELPDQDPVETPVVHMIQFNHVPEEHSVDSGDLTESTMGDSTFEKLRAPTPEGFETSDKMEHEETGAVSGLSASQSGFTETLMEQTQSRAVTHSDSNVDSVSQNMVKPKDDSSLYKFRTAHSKRKYRRMMQVLVIGCLVTLLGWLGNFFVAESCYFAAVPIEIGQYNVQFDLHYGLWRYSPPESALAGYPFCQQYGDDHKEEAPIMARVFHLLSLVAGTFSLGVLWFFLFTGRASPRFWRAAIWVAVLAAILQLLTLLFFTEYVCREHGCEWGLGSCLVLVIAFAWIVLALEMRYQAPHLDLIENQNQKKETDKLGFEWNSSFDNSGDYNPPTLIA